MGSHNDLAKGAGIGRTLQGFEGQQVVAEDEPVIEDVVIADPALGVVAPSRVLLQHARLQPRPVLLSDPRQLQA